MNNRHRTIKKWEKIYAVRKRPRLSFKDLFDWIERTHSAIEDLSEACKYFVDSTKHILEEERK